MTSNKWMFWCMVIFYALLSVLLVRCNSAELSLKKSLIFGPGLQADFVLPTRYFYLQAVDEAGKNFTTSPGKDRFSFTLTSKHTNRVIGRREVLDRNDGSFIFRYRLLRSYKDLIVEVTYDGEHVADSPYLLEGNVYHELCDCPDSNSDKWNLKMSCPESYAQIESDFKVYPEIDLAYIRKKGKELYEHDTAICHYSIIKNELFKKCYGSITGFSTFVEDWLFSIMRKIQLPDLEFWFNLSDWPRSHTPFPVISWGKSLSTHDILIPTYDLTKSVILGLDRHSIDMMTVQGNTGLKWDQKHEKGFFRGRDSNKERLMLMDVAKKDPELYDVGITRYFFFKKEEQKYGTNAHVSFFDFFNYKYQLNIDGTVAAYRFPYLLVADSIVFKQDSGYIEHFYSEIQPWKHYIPFKGDLSNLTEQINWARANDKEAKKIGQAGQTFARDNLMSDRLYCYTLRVLQQYAKRQKGKPMKHDYMEHIGMPKEDCNCQAKREKDEL